MQIKDLQVNQGNVELVAEVVEKSDVREFNKFGQPGKVANATLKDASGTVQLSLWNEQIESVNAGDTVKITNGYVKEFKGEKQITTGKFGKIEIVNAENNEKEDKKVYSNAPPKEDDGDDLILDDDDIVM